MKTDSAIPGILQAADRAVMGQYHSMKAMHGPYDLHEEDEYSGECDARIHRRGEDVVILYPPRGVMTADHELKYEPNDSPRYI